MKITVLAHLEKEDGEIADLVVGQVAAALRKGGHRVSVFGVHGDPRKLISGLIRRGPELVFNLLGAAGEGLLATAPVVGALDLLGLPYTGAGPGEYYLQEDKALARKLLAFDDISYPEFMLFARDAELDPAPALRPPLLVKPLRVDGAALGKSLVFSPEEMVERVQEIHARTRDAALVEEYVEGRDFTVAVLGNRQPLALPPLELERSVVPDGLLHVGDGRSRGHERASDLRSGHLTLAEVPDDLRTRLQEVAVAAYRALHVRDYGHVELRLTEDGEILVTETGTGCYLEQTAAFAAAAAAHGIDYPTLINRITDHALERVQARAGGGVSCCR